MVAIRVYTKQTPIQWFHRYDLASVTKILASVPLAMREYERDSLFLKTPISSLLEGYKESNKAEMNFQALFSHHAGIQPWLPFYRNTLRDNSDIPSKKLFIFFCCIVDDPDGKLEKNILKRNVLDVHFSVNRKN